MAFTTGRDPSAGIESSPQSFDDTFSRHPSRPLRDPRAARRGRDGGGLPGAGRELDRDVAIKVLPESVASDPEALARFEREAKAVAALSHPNILAIHDFGTHEGVAYAVMELLEGETLRGKLDAGPIPQKQAVDYALQIAKGLSAAHEKGDRPPGPEAREPLRHARTATSRSSTSAWRSGSRRSPRARRRARRRARATRSPGR